MQCWRSNSQEGPRCGKTPGWTPVSGAFGFGEGSTGHARWVQRGLFTGGTLCATELLPRPEATKSELPASAHSVWNGLSAEAQKLLRAGTGHSVRTGSTEGWLSCSPCRRTPKREAAGGDREGHERPGRGRPPSSRSL